jgi:hypothetical protein
MLKLESGLRDATKQRMHQRVEELVHGFSSYCDHFDEARLFSGPSLYFHYKTLAGKQKHQEIAD